MGIVLDWQKKLGYKHDPFVDEPTKHLVGLPVLREKLNLFLLKNQQVGVIRGDGGMGKTSIVLWLVQEIKSKRSTYVLDLKELSSRDKMEAYLERKIAPLYENLPYYDKLYTAITKKERTKEDRYKQLYLRLKKKPVVLIIEGASKLSSTHLALLNELMDKTLLQVILIDTPKALKKNPLKLAQSMSVLIGKYTAEQMEEMLKQRIERAGSIGTFPFDTRALHKLTSKTNGNPRTLLKLARDKAIELSLKGLKLPEKEVAAPKKQKDSMLFGKIKVEVRDEPVPKPKKAAQKQKKDKAKVEESELSEESKEDIELLRKIVGE